MGLCIMLGALLLQSSPHSRADTPSAEPKATPETSIALRYLDKLAKGTLDISKDTALSPYCSIKRRNEIREQLEFLQNTHFQDGDVFSYEGSRTEANFAAILLRSDNARSPLNIRIHAVALVKKNNQWLASPLPSRFTNTGYGYDPAVQKSVQQLEMWMAKEKTKRESSARQNAQANLLDSIKEEENSARLDRLDSHQAVENLLRQLKNKNLLGVLASLGAGSNQLPEPLDTTTDLISRGLDHSEDANAWTLVTHPSVITHTLKTDQKNKDVVVGFWNPLDSKHSHILYFPTEKQKGKTFTKLPNLLKSALLPEEERWREQWRNQQRDQEELVGKLPQLIYKHHPAKTFSGDPEEVSQYFIQALDSLNFLNCFRLIPRNGDFFDNPQKQAQHLNQLSQLWKSLHRVRANPRRDLDLIQSESLALLPLQFAKPNRSGEFHTIKVWLIRESGNWHLIPHETLNEYANDQLKAEKKKLETQLRALEKEQQEKHSKTLLARVTTLSPPLHKKNISADEAKKTLTRFRSTLRANDTTEALSLCAVLKGTSNVQTLKTFNYALRGASDHSANDHVLGVNSAGSWTAVSIRTESKTSHHYDYPLYLVVATEQGPKILLDIDLRHATNKGRKLLNNRNWKKLEEAVGDVSDVQTLFNGHSALATEDIKTNEPIKD